VAADVTQSSTDSRQMLLAQVENKLKQKPEPMRATSVEQM
jgi:hypothetical protein